MQGGWGREPSPYEAALRRPISFEDDRWEQRPELIAYDWQVLMNWEGTPNCRIALAAIITRAVLEEVPTLCVEAEAWLKEQVKAHNRLLSACLLWQAQLSPIMRGQVGEFLLSFAFGNFFSQGFEGGWQRVAADEHLSFEECAELTGAEDWLHMPPRDRIDLLGACRRITRDVPGEETLLAHAAVLLQVKTLSRLHYLQYGLARAMARPNAQSLRETAREHLDVLAPSIAAFLADPDPRQELLDAADCYAGLFELADLLGEALPRLSPDSREACVRSLHDKPLPWVCHIACEFIPHLPEELKESVVDLLVDWATSDDRNERRINPLDNQRAISHLNHLIHEDRPRFQEAVALLDLAQVAQLIVRSTESCSGRYDWSDLEGAFTPLMKAHPDDFAAAIAPILQEGRLPGRVVSTLVHNLGQERLGPDLNTWSRTVPSIRVDSDSVIQLIVSCSLPAGQLLLSTYGAERLQKAGYRLRPDDVNQTKTAILMLVDVEQSDRGEYKYQPKEGLWRDAQWRSVLLEHAADTEAVIRSVTISAPGRDEESQLQWLEKVFVPVCEQREELKRGLIAIAWDTGRIRDGQYTAQQLLLRQERISTWSTDEERGQMMVYCREHLSHLIQGLVQVFTTTQQRDLLFNHALTDKDRDSNSLPQPEPYHQAFTGNEERMNLARWLMRQAKLISTRSWLAWVIHFELVSLPGIGPRLTQRIELELGRLYGEELGIALKLLGQAKSQTA